MKLTNYKRLLGLFFVSISSLSLVASKLDVPLLSREERQANRVERQRNHRSPLTKNQRKLMDQIRRGEGITWISVKVGDTNFEDKYGNTPLMVAAGHGNMGALNGLLLFNSTSMNKQNDEGNTALMLAAMYGRAAAVKALLEYFNLVNVDIKNNEGKTALDLAQDGGYDKVIRLLEEFKNRKAE